MPKVNTVDTYDLYLNAYCNILEDYKKAYD